MATISRGDRYLKKLPLTATAYTDDMFIKMYDNLGQDLGVGYDDFITALNAAGLGGSSGGTGGVIDCGERMLGTGKIDCGTRI